MIYNEEWKNQHKIILPLGFKHLGGDIEYAKYQNGVEMLLLNDPNLNKNSFSFSVKSGFLDEIESNVEPGASILLQMGIRESFDKKIFGNFESDSSKTEFYFSEWSVKFNRESMFEVIQGFWKAFTNFKKKSLTEKIFQKFTKK